MPPQFKVEMIFPTFFYKDKHIKALHYTQPHKVFRYFLSLWEDSFAHTRFLLAFHHGKAKKKNPSHPQNNSCTRPSFVLILHRFKQSGRGAVG